MHSHTHNHHPAIRIRWLVIFISCCFLFFFMVFAVCVCVWVRYNNLLFKIIVDISASVNCMQLSQSVCALHTLLYKYNIICSERSQANEYNLQSTSKCAPFSSRMPVDIVGSCPVHLFVPFVCILTIFSMPNGRYSLCVSCHHHGIIKLWGPTIQYHTFDLIA